MGSIFHINDKLAYGDSLGINHSYPSKPIRLATLPLPKTPRIPLADVAN